MGFRDLTEVMGVREPKVLPVKGRMIEFPGTVSARCGQVMLMMVRAGQAADSEEDGLAAVAELIRTGEIDPDDASRLEREVIGPEAMTELLELEVSQDELTRIVSTLTVWHLAGQEAAEAAWEGKAPAPARAVRRATSRRTAGSSSSKDGSAGAQRQIRRT